MRELSLGEFRFEQIKASLKTPISEKLLSGFFIAVRSAILVFGIEIDLIIKTQNPVWPVSSENGDQKAA